MTPKQQECLAYLREYVRQHEYAPSFVEIAERLKVASKSGVHRLLVALEEQGLIRRLPHRSRSIVVVGLKAPLITPETLRDAIVKDHGFDDGEGSMIACSPEELLVTLRAALR